MVDPTRNPLNHEVIARLQARYPGAPVLAAPADHPDPYRMAGSHPDVVERVWDKLGAALPPDARVLVFGTVALIHPMTGAILVLAAGTMYVLRLKAPDLKQAARTPIRPGWIGRVLPRRGLEPLQVARLTDGSVYDVRVEYGPDWVLGKWDEREPDWLVNSFREFSETIPTHI